MIGKIQYCLVFLIFCLPVQAEIYKWIDADGHTHYGEKPPNEDAEKIIIKNTRETDGAIEEHNEKREKLLEIYEEERNLKQEEKREAEEEQKKKEKYCNNIKNNLVDLRNGGVFYQLDENGERKYLSEEVVKKRKKEMEEAYRKNCK